MPAQLLAINGGASILLDKPILLLGRDPECDIQLESPKISRRHCCIAQVGESLVVRDLGSTNGIRINGVRVVEGHLKGGDELTIGNHRFQVRWDALAPSAASDRKKPAAAVKPSNEPAPALPADDMLESCDEPVALAEPAGSPADVPRGKSPPAPPPPLDPDSSEESSNTPPPASADKPPNILPDQIHLARPSGAQRHITPP
jgi:predicted component of type VI protein secretion system